MRRVYLNFELSPSSSARPLFWSFHVLILPFLPFSPLCDLTMRKYEAGNRPICHRRKKNSHFSHDDRMTIFVLSLSLVLTKKLQQKNTSKKKGEQKYRGEIHTRQGALLFVYSAPTTTNIAAVVDDVVLDVFVHIVRIKSFSPSAQFASHDDDDAGAEDNAKEFLFP